MFVNAPLEQVVQTSEELGLSMLQLHGDEGPSFCAEAARRNGARVIKAAQVSGPGDVRDLERFHVDFHLLDARAAAPGAAGPARRHGRDVRLDAAARAALEGPADPQRRAERRERRRGDRAWRTRTRWTRASGTEAAPGRKDPERAAGVLRAPSERATTAGDATAA